METTWHQEAIQTKTVARILSASRTKETLPLRKGTERVDLSMRRLIRGTISSYPRKNLTAMTTFWMDSLVAESILYFSMMTQSRLREKWKGRSVKDRLSRLSSESHSRIQPTGDRRRINLACTGDCQIALKVSTMLLLFLQEIARVKPYLKTAKALTSRS